MNQKIQELIKQAGTDCSGKWMGMNHAEKFAELIVRECSYVCESMQLIGPYKEVQDATLKDAVMQIKEHFGVEE